MNKNYLIALLFVALIAQASAVQYVSYNYPIATDNVTTRLYTSITYSTFEKPAQAVIQPNQNPFSLFMSPSRAVEYILNGVPNPFLEQSIQEGKPLEYYYLYSAYVDDWNTKAPSNEVNFCNFTVYYSQQGSNTQTSIYNDIMTTKTLNAKYFVRLNKGDTATAYMDCQFAGNRTLTMPAEYTVVFPTWECKECQYYEWNKDFIKLEKAKNLGTYYTQVWSYIKTLITINYEIALTIFWIMVIIVAILSIGLILMGVYWVYLYISKHSR